MSAFFKNGNGTAGKKLAGMQDSSSKNKGQHKHDRRIMAKHQLLIQRKQPVLGLLSSTF
jgi:hypothetical protein